MTTRKRVWFHRSRAIIWAVFGILSFVFGWANNVALVWAASVYANIVSDWTASEAADDSLMLERLDVIEQYQLRIDAKLDAILEHRRVGRG